MGERDIPTYKDQISKTDPRSIQFPRLIQDQSTSQDRSKTNPRPIQDQSMTNLVKVKIYKTDPIDRSRIWIIKLI